MLPDAAPLPAARLLQLELALALRSRPALEQLLKDQQNPSSLRYRHWLTPEQFADQFGPDTSDVASVAAWLKDQGFEVHAASRLGRYVAFTGTVVQMEQTFHVRLVGSRDGKHFGNTTNPMIPTRFRALIAAIRGLDNLVRFEPVNASLPPPVPVRPGRVVRGFNYGGRGPNAFGPRDVWTFYDEDSPLTTDNDGSGSGCIALVETSEFSNSAVGQFNRIFKLPAANIRRVYPGRRPGKSLNAEIEALTDIEYAHGIAPGARIVVFLDQSDLLPSIRAAVMENRCSAIGISFGYCTSDASFYLNSLDPLYAQAAAQGQSVFVASGDYGAAGLTDNCSSADFRAVSETAASPNVTAVGGTQFSPTYDGSGNDIGNVAEQAWSEHDAANNVYGAGGGGASNVFPKPAYQTGPGVPNDGKRDIPDVSMAAGIEFVPGFYLVLEFRGLILLGCCIGGTSIGPPIWSGITELLTQKIGQRVGNLNPIIYKLGQQADPATGLRDVISGDNGFPLTGVLGYPAGPGYDLATGWGTPDIATFIDAYAEQSLPPPPIVPARLNMTASLTFARQVVLGSLGVPSSPKSVVLSNPKNGKQDQTIIIQGLNATGDFSVASQSCLGPLRPKESCKVPLVFTPSASGRRKGSFVVSANIESPASAATLVGIGVTGKLSYGPTTLSFGKVPVSTSSPAKSVTLTNNNAVLMELGTITISDGFEITANTCASTLAANGGACSVSVAFAPSTVGKARGTLTIPDNAAGNPQVVKLSGIGT